MYLTLLQAPFIKSYQDGIDNQQEDAACQPKHNRTPDRAGNAEWPASRKIPAYTWNPTLGVCQFDSSGQERTGQKLKEPALLAQQHSQRAQAETETAKNDDEHKPRWRECENPPVAELISMSVPRITAIAKYLSQRDRAVSNRHLDPLALFFDVVIGRRFHTAHQIEFCFPAKIASGF